MNEAGKVLHLSATEENWMRPDQNPFRVDEYSMGDFSDYKGKRRTGTNIEYEFTGAGVRITELATGKSWTHEGAERYCVMFDKHENSGFASYINVIDITTGTRYKYTYGFDFLGWMEKNERIPD